MFGVKPDGYGLKGSREVTVGTSLSGNCALKGRRQKEWDLEWEVLSGEEFLFYFIFVIIAVSCCLIVGDVTA